MASTPQTSPGTALAAPKSSSLIHRMAERFNLEPTLFLSTVKQTLMPNKGVNVTNEQLAAFLMTAEKYSLNPFTKEIYAFPTQGGGIMPVVSIDGWSTLLNRQAEYDGIEFLDNLDDSGNLRSITARIYRKDRQRAVEVTEYMNECKKGTEPWQKWPARMLRHKAMIQCARYAFGLSGIVDPDEAERMAEPNPSAVQAQVADVRVKALSEKYIKIGAAAKSDPAPANVQSVTTQANPSESLMADLSAQGSDSAAEGEYLAEQDDPVDTQSNAHEAVTAETPGGFDFDYPKANARGARGGR